MNTPIPSDPKELTWLAGYLATRKAKIEVHGTILAISCWSKSLDVSQRLLNEWGGGLIYRQGYYVWCLAGESAQELMTELLPLFDQYTPELAEKIRQEMR